MKETITEIFIYELKEKIILNKWYNFKIELTDN